MAYDKVAVDEDAELMAAIGLPSKLGVILISILLSKRVSVCKKADVRFVRLEEWKAGLVRLERCVLGNQLV